MPASESQPIVRVTGLSKIYGRGENRVAALDDVSLMIEKGEFLALMGPSGSGKSTLLHIIAGIDRPSEGSVEVGGAELTHLGESALADWRNNTVGFIFQSFNLIPVLTAEENVELPLLLTSLSRAERRSHVDLALRLVGLEDRRKHRPRQLSGGQEQRVAIARAIVTDPSLIVADEPTGNLDARSAEDVLKLLARINREFGTTIIMVTHDLKAAMHGTRMLHLEKGRMWKDEAVDEELRRALAMAAPGGRGA